MQRGECKCCAREGGQDSFCARSVSRETVTLAATALRIRLWNPVRGTSVLISRRAKVEAREPSTERESNLRVRELSLRWRRACVYPEVGR